MFLKDVNKILFKYFRPGPSFDSETGNVDKHNWLEIVQKSQEYKIGLNVER